MIEKSPYKNCVVSHNHGHLSLSGDPKIVCGAAQVWVEFQKTPEEQQAQGKLISFKISGKNPAKVADLFREAPEKRLNIMTVTIDV